MKNIADKSNMYQMILDFPHQFPQGYKAAGDAGKKYAQISFDSIVVAGMGGSALPGNLLRTFAEELDIKLPIIVHRNYGLPPALKLTRALVIIISYSGNTEEALSVYDEAHKSGLAVAAITTGGKLGERAKADGHPLILVRAVLPPRLAMGYQFSALVAFLANAGIIKSQTSTMDALEKSLRPTKILDDAKKLLPSIEDKTPLIYASQKYGVLAHILKTQFNENAKIHAFANTFPELNHNELEGYGDSNSSQFVVLFLKSPNDKIQIQKRMELTAQIIEKQGFAVHTIDIKGENIYNEIFNTTLFGFWLSYYLAINKNIDPTPVQIIEDFKKKLK